MRKQTENRIESIFGIWNTAVHMEPRSLAEKIGKLLKKQRLGDCKVKKVICVVQKQSHFSCHKPKSEMKRNTEELRNEIIAFNYSCYTPCKRLKTDEVYKMCRFAGKGQIGRSRLHNLNMAIVNYKLNLNLSRSESRNTKIAWNSNCITQKGNVIVHSSSTAHVRHELRPKIELKR